MSAKKRVSQQTRATELGAEIDSEYRSLGLPGDKLLKLLQGTWWLLLQKVLNRKHAQIMAGRWMFTLQFRRPAMCVFNRVWAFTSANEPVTTKLLQEVKDEFMMAIMISMTCHCNLGALVSPVMMASDASQTGGAVGFAEELSLEGIDFVCAQQALSSNRMNEQIPVLLLSLFNGIGGCFRAYDLVGLCPMVRIAVEQDSGANRITTHRWPGTVIVDDVHKLDLTLMKLWSRTYLRILEIHVWGGWPCVDLSSAKANRRNLLGKQSGLFWLIPEILKNLRLAFGPNIRIRFVLENVASMDESAAREISDTMGVIPYRLDSVHAVPMRRARFCWSSERVENCLDGITVEPGRYWKDVCSPAEYPKTTQWLTPGFEWEGEQRGAVFPTAMKSIPRLQPPPRPAGLHTCSWDCKARWIEDGFRYPPYQYDSDFLITSPTTWRLLSADEKELLLGYGYNHTAICWPASKIKQNKVGYSDARHSYLGDSFSMYSFAIMAVACCQQWLPRLPFELLAQRMGMAPGFRAPIRCLAPLARKLQYGTQLHKFSDLSAPAEQMNRIFLRQTNRTGSDIRIITGEILAPKPFPRESVSAQWWKWKDGFKVRWQSHSHINVLELEAILLAVKHQISHFKTCDSRIFHLSDSYVCISVVSKGRSSSKQLQRVLKKLAAHLLIHGLQLVIAHVDSNENPTDRASRQ